MPSLARRQVARRLRLFISLFFFLLLAGLAVSSAAAKEEKEKESTAKKSSSTEKSSKRKVVGWTERIVLYPEGLALDAKLTPGSEGNVLHAEKIKYFKKKGKRWIRFVTSSRNGESPTLERELVDQSQFRTTSGAREKRPVIMAGFCLHKKYLELEFALADRSSFEQEVRIGRDALAGHFIIDPAKTKSTKPRCKDLPDTKSTVPPK